jgi:hypothetical protein
VENNMTGPIESWRKYLVMELSASAPLVQLVVVPEYGKAVRLQFRWRDGGKFDVQGMENIPMVEEDDIAGQSELTRKRDRSASC